MHKALLLNNLESEESARFSRNAVLDIRRAVLAPPGREQNIQRALRNVDFQFHRRCSYSSLIRECNAAEGQTFLIFWGHGSSESGITIMSASSSASIHMSPASPSSHTVLRSTGQQTDISCHYPEFSPPEAEDQRALRERIADSLTFPSTPSPPLRPTNRSASILGSVCALLLRKQAQVQGSTTGGAKQLCEPRRSWQSASICRICFGGASRERLARPCGCRGTVAAVHRSCLERWLLQAATSHCELCRHHYVVTRTHKWSWWRAAVSWARAGGARALLADASRGAALAAGALLGTARALRACDAALQAGARRGGLVALAANLFSSLLIGLVGALNGLLTTWMLLKVQEHQAAWRAWRDSTLHVRVVLPDGTPDPSAPPSTRASSASRPSPPLSPPAESPRAASPGLTPGASPRASSLRMGAAAAPPTVDRSTNMTGSVSPTLTVNTPS